jgi:hypothetical protein
VWAEMIQKEWVKHSDSLPWDSMTGPNTLVKITNYYLFLNDFLLCYVAVQSSKNCIFCEIS